MRVALVGNPNCGKTTVFNALTGSNQRVGNWAGVTVEKKTGHFEYHQQRYTVIDLPGIYAMMSQQDASIDEKIAAEYILSNQADILINVIDASNLERNLYLTTQLLELGLPMVVALNMSDIAKARKISIDLKRLAQNLQCPVVSIQAHKALGMDELKQQLLVPKVSQKPALKLPESLNQALSELEQSFTGMFTSFRARQALAFGGELPQIKPLQAKVQEACNEEAEVLLTDARYDWVHQLTQLVQTQAADSSNHLTAKLDKIFLNRFLSIPLFLLIMYTMFLFAINIGGAFQDFFDIATDTVFVQGMAHLLTQWHWPSWSIALLAEGVGKGINTTLTFIPVIAAMFFFLSFLEASGYMARAAFVVDRAMRFLGLPGKSFVPMIVGFGCNVPAIMAARTLDNRRDQLLTILMSPYMACSARLAIFAVFVAAFFPSGGQNIVFSLYFIGIFLAVLTGLLLRKTVLRGESSPLVLELPPYHWPKFKRICKSTGYRLMFFLKRAAKFIIPVCVLLGGLNALTIGGGLSGSEASTDSVLSLLGKYLTPIFAPMGLHQENWPATVGLLTGTLAKEVVVGTLNSLYSSLGHFAQSATGQFDLWQGLKEALLSIPANLSNLKEAISNPIVASAPDGEMSQSVYGMMYRNFDGQVGAFAYLLFVLLYLPCVSTIAAIRQEASRRWMWFAILWSTLVAYAVAVIFYQWATFGEHPLQSLVWTGIFIMMILIIYKWLSSSVLQSKQKFNLVDNV